MLIFLCESFMIWLIFVCESFMILIDFCVNCSWFWLIFCVNSSWFWLSICVNCLWLWLILCLNCSWFWLLESNSKLKWIRNTGEKKWFYPEDGAPAVREDVQELPLHPPGAQPNHRKLNYSIILKCTGSSFFSNFFFRGIYFAKYYGLGGGGNKNSCWGKNELRAWGKNVKEG